MAIIMLRKERGRKGEVGRSEGKREGWRESVLGGGGELRVIWNRPHM